MDILDVRNLGVLALWVLFGSSVGMPWWLVLAAGVWAAVMLGHR